MKVDFITFCCPKDAYLLHHEGHLKRQVESNLFEFNKVWAIHQNCISSEYKPFNIECETPSIGGIQINKILIDGGIDVAKEQYHSEDKAHYWKYHVVNHLFGLQISDADYIVFADNDCWMKEPINWINRGIALMNSKPDALIISPNDGESPRKTLRMSQQMFMCKRLDFLNIDWNQPGYSGNVRDYPQMPEYHAMLEGRMEHYGRHVDRYRYVLERRYRYWHHNRLGADGYYEVDYSKY